MKNLEYMTQNGLVGLKFLRSCCCLVKKSQFIPIFGAHSCFIEGSGGMIPFQIKWESITASSI